MDQDSFRQLLQGSASARKPAANGASSNSKKGKTKKSDSAQPAFKPRTVKKQDDRYRDRAAERRLGVAHDFAEVEALAEDFERRNADQDRAVVEEQRQYLGGDSEHTVLVKGLDFALLEQNRARAAAATEDDDALEQVFAEVVQPKKRTREDIVNELRNKRQKSDVAEESASPPVPDASLDDAKKAGKFKPIGFKPIGPSEAKKKKKVKAKKDDAGAGTKKKASSKAKAAAAEDVVPSAPSSAAASTSKPAPPPLKSAPEPEPVDEDFDIFADAGEYTGVDLGDDDDKDDESDGEINDDDTDRPSKTTAHEEEPLARGRWFDTEESQPEPTRRPSTPPPAKSHSPSALAEREEGEAEEEEEAPVRLAPLASSSIPSIREFLAMDMEHEKQKKRKERRDKKKGKAKSGGDDDDD